MIIHVWFGIELYLPKTNDIVEKTWYNDSNQYNNTYIILILFLRP